MDLADLSRRMTGAVSVLKSELAGLRTGRASASLLDPINVDAYGTSMPINQVATVSVPEPRMSSVQVWDKSTVQAVDRAILDRPCVVLSGDIGRVSDAGVAVIGRAKGQQSRGCSLVIDELTAQEPSR